MPSATPKKKSVMVLAEHAGLRSHFLVAMTRRCYFFYWQ